MKLACASLDAIVKKKVAANEETQIRFPCTGFISFILYEMQC